MLLIDAAASFVKLSRRVVLTGNEPPRKYQFAKKHSSWSDNCAERDSWISLQWNESVFVPLLYSSTSGALNDHQTFQTAKEAQGLGHF